MALPEPFRYGPHAVGYVRWVLVWIKQTVGIIESHPKLASCLYQEGGLIRESSPEKIPSDDTVPVLGRPFRNDDNCQNKSINLVTGDWNADYSLRLNPMSFGYTEGEWTWLRNLLLCRVSIYPRTFWGAFTDFCDAMAGSVVHLHLVVSPMNGTDAEYSRVHLAYLTF